MAQAGAVHSSGFWGSPHFKAKCRQGTWKVPKQVCISGQREELRCSVSVPKTNCAASFQPWWACLGLGEEEVLPSCPHSWLGRPAYSCSMGRRALCVPLCPPGWQCCSLRGWAPRDCPKESWCLLLHWRPQPCFWNGCLTLLGNEDWLQTQVTGRYFSVVTGKEQRAFLDVPVVMSCVSTKHKAFPSPAAWMFHFTSVFFVAGG